jgi:hypothetical protein
MKENFILRIMGSGRWGGSKPGIPSPIAFLKKTCKLKYIYIYKLSVLKFVKYVCVVLDSVSLPPGLSINYTGPSSCRKKNLPGRDLTKVENHWSRVVSTNSLKKIKHKFVRKFCGCPSLKSFRQHQCDRKWKIYTL